MLDFCDSEVVEALKFHLRDLSVCFRLGETVARVDADPEGTVTTLASGKRIPADTVMYSAGRQGATTRWNSRPPAVGWMTRGTLRWSRSGRSSVSR
jgi:NAD(P) transhydrogenase